MIAAREKQAELKNDPEWIKKRMAPIHEGLKRRGYNRFRNPLSREHKSKIGDAVSVAQRGSKNSQFGKKWLKHPEHGNKSVPKDEVEKFLSLGWKIGRDLKFKK